MAMNRFYDYDNNFVVTQIVGQLSDRILVDHVIKLNEGSQRIPGFREFADCSLIGDMSQLTAPGTAKAASHEVVRLQSKLAIYVGASELVYGMARAYQTFSLERRQEVQIFKEKEPALEWLSASSDDLSRMLSFVQESTSQNMSNEGTAK